MFRNNFGILNKIRAFRRGPHRGLTRREKFVVNETRTRAPSAYCAYYVPTSLLIHRGYTIVVFVHCSMTCFLRLFSGYSAGRITERVIIPYTLSYSVRVLIIRRITVSHVVTTSARESSRAFTKGRCNNNESFCFKKPWMSTALIYVLYTYTS